MTKFYKNSKIKLTLFIAIFLISTFYANTILISNELNSLDNKSQKVEEDSNYSHLTTSPYLNDGEESLLFEGTENPLNVTDYGNLYKYNQKVSLGNQDSYNLTYNLDEIHNWKSNKIENSIKNLQDKRNWINNSGFLSPDIYRVYGKWETDHNYSRGKNINWNNPSFDTIITASGVNSMFIRVHFVKVEFEIDWDFLFICNSSNEIYYVNTSGDVNFYSPWIQGDTIKLIYSSDSTSVELFGYEIDYYEYVNSSSNININSDNWQFNYQKVYGTGGYPDGFNHYGTAEVDNSTAMYVALYGSYVDENEFDYMTGAYSEIQQNFTIPSGSVVDAYLSFNYYCQYALPTNDHYLYVKINDQKIYSKGMLDISELGKRKWLSSGKLYTDAWDNLTNIFNEDPYQQQFNISLGFMVGSGYSYSSSYSLEEGLTNIIYFDNISLVVTTKVNSTQEHINLKINDEVLEDGDTWGFSNKTFTGLWEDNPIVLNINCSSPFLTFDMNTTIYGYREDNTKINQQNEEGISYEILRNGTIYWEFYHNFYMPPEYSEFEFIIDKPGNWKIISVLDPTFMPILFEGGNIGDNYLKINKTSAIFPGWWKIKATTPNYIDEENTDLSKFGEWGYSEFFTGESTKIRTQINYSNEIPLNLDQTMADLKVYYPNGSVWIEESKVPFSNGTVIFSEITFTSSNSVGGIYNYTLFWSNGTSLGGISSDFTVIHDSYITLLEPDDAKDDNRTGGIVGDIIPLRIYLRDAENDLYISGASISYNWTTGTEDLVEIASGIYDAILDTADLGGNGLYRIIITSNQIGFLSSNFTLEINLGEESVLQRLDSDSEIIIHENSTITFKYYSDFDEEGIEGALVTLNISNPLYYRIQDLSDGLYSIEFNTEYFNTTGSYQLYFEFSAVGFEPQIHLYRFEIINPPQQNSQPPYLLWIFLASAIVVSAILASLSLRSYVILPRRRKREADLLSETQRFKDIRNIQAIVIIHKLSGIPLYSKSYSILEKHKKELFSGFIQAITTIGEEFSEEGKKSEEKKKIEKYGTEKIIELDFKYFYCVIADLEELRVVLVLREKSSDRLKDQVRQLLLALKLKLSEELQDWDGSLELFETLMPPIINEYFELYYKEEFRLALKDYDYLKIKKERNFTKLETRVLNVIESISNTKGNIIKLDTIIDLVHEDNKDLVIKAIESLLEQKIIVPINI